MFRWLLIATATFLLMAGIELGRILLGMRGFAPNIGHWLLLLACIAVLLLLLTVVGFLDYKAEKSKGNIRRILPLYERALALAEAKRADAAPESPDEDAGPPEGAHGR